MSDRITAIVVDDEPLARKGLMIRLEEFPEVEVLAEAGNGREAISKVAELQPDVIFLDIQMPGLNGFQVIQELNFSQIKMPLVIFVTAYDHYAIRAFDVHALDYLLKPVDENRLLGAIQKVQLYQSESVEDEKQQQLVKLVSDLTGDDCEEILRKLADGEPLNGSSYPDVMVIKDGSEINRVNLVDVNYIDAAGDYMCVHANSDTLIMRKTMKELEQELDPRKFVRVHRSTIVNIKAIEKMVSHISGEYQVVLNDGKELKVSRSYRDNVKAALSI
jgi:two-component system LytT family response regulator